MNVRDPLGSSYLTRLAAWLSQGFNVIFLGGHQNQTVSARCYENRCRQPWQFWYTTINSIFFWQEDHCKDSWRRDVDFALEIL